MDKQYSKEFFTSFLENLQNLCRNYLAFSQFVEVSGYVCVNIDSKKTERYVLCELLQCVGNVVSESYCTKAFTLSKNGSQNLLKFTNPQMTISSQETNRANSVFAEDPGLSLNSRLLYKQKTKNASRCASENYEVERRKQSNSYSDRSPSRTFSERTKIHGKQQEQRFQDRSCLTSSQISRPFSKQSLESNFMYSQAEGEIDNPIKMKPTLSLEQGFQDRDKTRTDHETWIDSVKVKTEILEEKAVTLPDYMLDTGSQNSLVCYTASSEDGVPGSGSKTAEDEDDTIEDLIDLDLMDDEVESSFQEDSTLEFDSKSGCVSNIPNASGLRHGSGPARQMSKGSLMVMKSAIKQFLRYHMDNSGQVIDLFSTSPEQLNKLLLDFYQKGRTLSGKELTAGSLKNVQIYLDKYLREGGYPYSISKDDQFKVSRNFIKTKVNESSKCVTVQRHVPVNENDIEILFATGQMGLHSPDAIVNTLWFLNTKFFAFKGPTEHFNLKWGDIGLSPCEEFVGRVHKGSTQFSLKVSANRHHPDRCFVNVYKVYRSIRPKLMLEADSPFYLKPNKQSMSFPPESLSWSALTCLWRRMIWGARLPTNKKVF